MGRGRGRTPAAVRRHRPRLGARRPSIGPERSAGRGAPDDFRTRLRILLGEDVRPPSTRAAFADDELLAFAGRGANPAVLEVLRLRATPWILGPRSPAHDAGEAWARVLGLDLFARRVLSLELMDHQVAMAYACLASKRAVCLAGRQSGKDVTQAALAVWEAVTVPNARIVVVSGAQRQSDLLMEKALGLVARDAKLFDSVRHSSREALEWTNGSFVKAAPRDGPDPRRDRVARLPERGPRRPQRGGDVQRDRADAAHDRGQPRDLHDPARQERPRVGGVQLAAVPPDADPVDGLEVRDAGAPLTPTSRDVRGPVRLRVRGGVPRRAVVLLFAGKHRAVRPRLRRRDGPRGGPRVRPRDRLGPNPRHVRDGRRLPRRRGPGAGRVPPRLPRRPDAGRGRVRPPPARDLRVPADRERVRGPRDRPDGPARQGPRVRRRRGVPPDGGVEGPRVRRPEVAPRARDGRDPDGPEAARGATRPRVRDHPVRRDDDPPSGRRVRRLRRRAHARVLAVPPAWTWPRPDRADALGRRRRPRRGVVHVADPRRRPLSGGRKRAGRRDVRSLRRADRGGPGVRRRGRAKARGVPDRSA